MLLMLKESVYNATRKFHRKQESVMIRIRIGHTWITPVIKHLPKCDDKRFCPSFHNLKLSDIFRNKA